MHTRLDPLIEVPDELGPPDPGGRFGEARAVLEVPRLLVRAPWLSRLPRGDGSPVVVFPGFGTSDLSTQVLRTFLRLLGYDVRAWGLGRNHGDVPALTPRVADLVAEIAEEQATPVHAIGWSLGGVLAREAARERPDAVRSVVTFGTPVVGGAKYTAVGRRYAEDGVDLDAIELRIAAREAELPIDVPITAIYSRSDAVVAWGACIDRTNPHVEHVEVRGTHSGLGFSPEVYEIIATRLSAR